MRKLFVAGALFCCSLLPAQNRADRAKEPNRVPKSVYVELFGPSGLVGISFDSRFNAHTPWGYRGGIAYGLGISDVDFIITSHETQHSLAFPLELNYLTQAKRNKFEMGLGALVGCVWDQLDYELPNTPLITENSSDFSYAFYGNIGYRYQKMKGFMLRTGLTIGTDFSDGVVLFPYLALGYTF